MLVSVLQCPEVHFILLSFSLNLLPEWQNLPEGADQVLRDDLDGLSASLFIRMILDFGSWFSILN